MHHCRLPTTSNHNNSVFCIKSPFAISATQTPKQTTNQIAWPTTTSTLWRRRVHTQIPLHWKQVHLAVCLRITAFGLGDPESSSTEETLSEHTNVTQCNHNNPHTHTHTQTLAGESHQLYIWPTSSWNIKLSVPSRTSSSGGISTWRREDDDLDDTPHNAQTKRPQTRGGCVFIHMCGYSRKLHSVHIVLWSYKHTISHTHTQSKRKPSCTLPTSFHLLIFAAKHLVLALDNSNY